MPNLTLPTTGFWLIDPRAGRVIQDGQHRLSHAAVDGGVEIPHIWTAANRDVAKLPKAVAVLPLTGIMEPRASDYTYYYGGTSTEAFGAAFDRVIGDPSIKAVLIDGYTPGGMVYGTPELARKIFSARGSKPIVAIANPLVASAGLWVCSAADRFYITPSGDAGSHGAYSMHIDESKMLEEIGLKVTYTYAGKYKVEGNPYQPASAEFLESEQQAVDEIMGAFTADLAKFRGKTTAHVLDQFGQGRLLNAKASVAAGMCDGVVAFEQVVARLMSGHIRVDGAAANDDWTSPLKAEEPEVPDVPAKPEMPKNRFGNADTLKRQLAVARR